jgi:hypothetical protein
MNKTANFREVVGYPHHRRGRTGRLVCRCNRGYASEYDGKCYNCRGCTAYTARMRDLGFEPEVARRHLFGFTAEKS